MATLTRPSPELVSADGKLSADFWASMPETKPHYELIDGELKRKMSTRQEHAYAAFRLALQLALWGDNHGWTFQTEGVGVRPDAFNGFVPDVIGFSPGNRPAVKIASISSAFLVAEVLSPATAAKDRAEKMLGYARAEVEIYLIVDAEQKQIEVYRLDGDSYGETEILSENAVWQPAEFAGLQLDLAQLWM